MWNGTTWTALTGDQPLTMAASGSMVYGDFSNYGLYMDDGTTWSLLTKSHPQKIAALGSLFYADFATYGLYSWNGTAWTNLTMLGTQTSLLAYHLPLDAHPVLGNNAQLARVLGLETRGTFGGDDGTGLVHYAYPEPGMDAAALTERIRCALGRTPLHIPGAHEVIRSVGWCTGAAQSWIEAAAGRGLEAFISGEISEQTVHVARECGIHYFAAGHHATERFGVQALGGHLADRFSIMHRFVDIENPV